jgi:hypothetical protein
VTYNDGNLYIVRLKICQQLFVANELVNTGGSAIAMEIGVESNVVSIFEFVVGIASTSVVAQGDAWKTRLTNEPSRTRSNLKRARGDRSLRNTHGWTYAYHSAWLVLSVSATSNPMGMGRIVALHD